MEGTAAPGKMALSVIAGRFVWWVMLIALFVLPCMLGWVSGAIAPVAAFLLLPFIDRSSAAASLRAQPAMLIFLVAPALLFGLFAITADSPSDLLYGANFVPLVLAIPAFFYARSLGGEATLLLVARLCLAGVAVAVLVGLAEVLALHLVRASGFASNPNVFARLALALGFLALIGVFASPGRRRWWFYLGPLLGLAATILSGSRGALLAAPVMAVVFTGFLLIGSTARRRGIYSLVIIIAVIAAIALIDRFASSRITTMVDTIVATLTEGTSTDSSTSVRLAMYRAGFAAFIMSPWIGYGWGNMVAVVVYYIDIPNIAVIIRNGPHLHNDFIDFAVAAGLPGIASWAAILFAPLLGALMAPRDALFKARLYGCALLSVTWFAYGMTDMALGYDVLTSTFALVTAILLGSMVVRPIET